MRSPGDDMGAESREPGRGVWVEQGGVEPLGAAWGPGRGNTVQRPEPVRTGLDRRASKGLSGW